MFAVQAFAKDRRNVHIHLRMDNTSALAYVTKMGGTRSTRLTAVACQIWDWCLQRQITLSASHVPGLDNQVADQESSQVQTSAEWKLHKEIFTEILYSAGTVQNRSICNEAESPIRSLCEQETRSRSIGNQCLSPQLEGPRRLCLPSLLTDRQVSSEGETRAEHNCTSGSSMAEPNLVPDAPRVDGGVPTAFTRPDGHTERSNKPTSPIGMLQQVRLAAWRVSGNSTQQQEFQRKLLNYCWPVGAEVQTRLTNQDGSVGVAGVRDWKLIPFLVECSNS